MKLGWLSILFGVIVFTVDDRGALYPGANIVGAIAAIAWGFYNISNTTADEEAFGCGWLVLSLIFLLLGVLIFGRIGGYV